MTYDFKDYRVRNRIFKLAISAHERQIHSRVWKALKDEYKSRGDDFDFRALPEFERNYAAALKSDDFRQYLRSLIR